MMASDDAVLARNVGVTLSDDGRGMVQVPYRADGPRGTLSVWLDDELAVEKMPAVPRRYWNNNYHFALPDPTPLRHISVRIEYEGFGLEESLRVRVRPSRVPAPVPADDVQPAAVARAMYMLAKSHWHDDKLPADPLTAAAQLKDDMRVGLVQGANLWAAKKGLPIRTAGVSDVFEHVRASGGPAVLTWQDRTVVLTGVVRTEDGMFVEFEDPFGPSGTTVERIEPGMVRWGIAHIWQ